MSKRKAIKKLLRLRILWIGLVIVGAGVIFLYAPRLSEPTASEPIKIGFIGDSITYGLKDTNNAVESEMAALGRDFVAVNKGRNGATTTIWLPSRPFFKDALKTFVSQNVHVVSIMLGTNDARKDIAISPETYEENLSAIVAGLLASGTITKVIINYPPYVVPGAVGRWDETSLFRLRLYMSHIDKLTRQKGVVRGDTKSYSYFEDHSNQLVDGVHPNAEGSLQLGRLWASAYERVMSETLASRLRYSAPRI